MLAGTAYNYLRKSKSSPSVGSLQCAMRAVVCEGLKLCPQLYVVVYKECFVAPIMIVF